MAEGYASLIANPWAERVLIASVLAYTALALAGVALLAASTAAGDSTASSTFATIMQVSSTLAGAALVLRGLASLRSSRIAAYHWFMRGLLIWILLTQVFVFYSSQLAGLGGLAVDLVAYGSLRFALDREISADRDRSNAQSEES